MAFDLLGTAGRGRGFYVHLLPTVSGVKVRAMPLTSSCWKKSRRNARCEGGFYFHAVALRESRA